MRLAWAELQADVELDAALVQQFEAASDAVREAIAERQQERAAEEERARTIAREQADRNAICEEIEGLTGAAGADRIAELKVQWDNLPPMPSEYAAPLTRRFQDACRTFEDKSVAVCSRRLRQQGWKRWPPSWSSSASDLPPDDVVARWRGLRRDADVLRDHAQANPHAAERLERAIALLEEKEHQQAAIRAKQG